MTVRMKEALRRSLAGLALGGFIAFASVPAATAQWLRPWPAVLARRHRAEAGGAGVSVDCAAPSPTDGVSRRRERRPGGLSALGDRRLERRYPSALRWAPAPLGTRIRHARGRIRRAAAARRRRAAKRRNSRPCPTTNPASKSAYGGPPNVHIPAAISPFGSPDAPSATKPKPKSNATSHNRGPGTTTATPAAAPLPPPAPREATTPDAPPSVAPKAPADQEPDKPKTEPTPTEVQNAPPAPPGQAKQASVAATP